MHLKKFFLLKMYTLFFEYHFGFFYISLVDVSYDFVILKQISQVVMKRYFLISLLFKLSVCPAAFGSENWRLCNLLFSSYFSLEFHTKMVYYLNCAILCFDFLGINKIKILKIFFPLTSNLYPIYNKG